MEIKVIQCQHKRCIVSSDRKLVLTYSDKIWKLIKVLVGKLYALKNNPFVKNSERRTQGLYCPSRDYLPTAPLHWDQVGLDIFGTCTLDANTKPPTQSISWKAT